MSMRKTGVPAVLKTSAVASVLVAAALTTAPPAAAATEMSLFSNSNYGGCALYTTFTGIYDFASYSYGSGTNCPKLNDSVSSLVNGFYASVTFYTNAGYVGNTQTVAARTWLTGVKYNDQYSSYTVR
jgi:hypothetical protein